MQNYPTISIITPSYNQAAYLEQTIQSVINQNYPLIEYIIIDGGSSDGSVEIIKKYSEHIAHWISERDSGQSYAINKGLRMATGEIVCWLNSDDLMEPNALDRVSRFFRENVNAQFLYGDGIIFYENKEKLIQNCRPGKVDKFLLSYCDPIQQPSTFWRRKIHNEIGFINESLQFVMDWDFFMRVALSYDLYYLPISFSRYRIHDAHKTGVGGGRRSEEIMTFVQTYGSKYWAELFLTIYPFAAEIRIARKRFGWRLGRLFFYFCHPQLALKYNRNLNVVLNMY